MACTNSIKEMEQNGKPIEYFLEWGGDQMQFPRKVMSGREIQNECGIPMIFLRQMAHVPGQKCAFTKPGGRKFFFDTDKLAKQMEKFIVR